MRNNLLADVHRLIDGLGVESTKSSNLNSVLNHIAELAKETFSADLCLIFFIDPLTEQYLLPPTLVGDLHEEAHRSYLSTPRPDGLTRQILNRGVLCVNDLKREPQFASPFTTAEGICSFAAFALHSMRYHKPLAVLYIDYRQPHEFDSQDQDFFALFAKQAALILNKSWFLGRYNEIAQIGQEINQDLTSVEALCHKLWSHARRILGMPHFFLLAVYKPLTGGLDLHMYDKGQYKTRLNEPLDGGCSWVIEKQIPLVIQHQSQEQDALAVKLVDIPDTTVGEESLIFVPLVFRNVSLGVLSIQHLQPNIYDNEDVQLLQLLANHVGLALNTIDLFESLTQINRTGQLLTQELNSEKILQEVVQQILTVAAADIVTLYPYQQDAETFLLPPKVSGRFFAPRFAQPSASRPDDMATLAIQKGKSIFARESADLYTFLGGDMSRRKGGFESRESIRSTAVVPLRVSDETVGVLFVNYRYPQLFKAAQRELIQNLAIYAAIAIRNSREFSSIIERRAEELETLRKIDNQVSKTLDLQEILETALRLAVDYIPADEASILLYNAQKNVLETKTAIGSQALQSQVQAIALHNEQQQSITRWVFEHQQVVRIEDFQTSPEWKERQLVVNSATRAELDVPLLDGIGRCIGVLNFESTEPRAFSKADEQFLVILAEQMVLAIKNAQAYEREKQIAEDRNTLIAISKAITVDLEPTRLFQLILDKALEAAGAVAGNLMLYDTLRQDLWMAAERGVEEDKKQRRQSLDEGVVGWVAINKRLLNVNVCQPPWDQLYVRFIPNICAELAVPMLEGDTLRGVINIESAQPSHFTERDERLLTALADLAVIALQNTERYQHAAEGREKLNQLHHVDEKIISQTEDPDQVMQTVVESALSLTPALSADLHLYTANMPGTTYFAYKADNEIVQPILRVDADDPASNTIARGIVAHVANTRQPYMTLGDAQLDPWFVGNRDVHSNVAVPLLAQDGDLIGVLNLESPEQFAFNNDDLEILNLLAGQAVIAIQNARNIQRFLLLYDVSRQLGNLVDVSQLEQVYDIILKVVQKHTGSQVIIRRYEEATHELAIVRAARRWKTPPPLRMKLDGGVSGLAVQRLKTIVIDDIKRPPSFVKKIALSSDEVASLAVTPIHIEDAVYGTLGLSHERVGYFRDIDLKLIEGLAHQLALTIHRLEATQAKRQVEQRLAEAEIMSSIGQQSYELAHRLGNDLGLVKSYVNNVKLALGEEYAHQPAVEGNLDKIVRDVRKVLDLSARLRQELAEFSPDKLRQAERVTLPLTVLIEEAVQTANLPTTIQLVLDIAPDLAVVRVAPKQVIEIFHNLITNAKDAMQGVGRLTFKAYNLGRYVKIEVSDTGPGIPESKQSRIFDLFYSTKGSSGFGLWSARRDALANGGELKVSSQPGQGATFVVTLPQADREA